MQTKSATSRLRCKVTDNFPFTDDFHQIYLSPFFNLTSLTYFRTSAEESSFLQISSTLSFSATI